MDIDLSIGGVQISLKPSPSSTTSTESLPTFSIKQELSPEYRGDDNGGAKCYTVDLSNFTGLLYISTEGMKLSGEPASEQKLITTTKNPLEEKETEGHEFHKREEQHDTPVREKKSFADEVGDSKARSEDKHGKEEEFFYDPDVSDAWNLTPVNTDTMEFHTACAQPKISVVELRDILATCPNAPMEKDRSGKFPLHILSQNEDLLYFLKDDLEDFQVFVWELFDAFPASIVVKDNNGSLPFVAAIIKWTDSLYIVDENKKSNGFSRGLQLLFQQGDKEPSDSYFPFNSQDVSPKDRLIHSDVSISYMCAWCLRMMSLAMIRVGESTDHLEQAHESSSLDNFDFQYARKVLAEEVASIPRFMKSLLLIEDDNRRQEIFSLPLIRCVLLRKESVGAWIVPMLEAQGAPGQRVVDYFVMASDVTAREFAGSRSSPTLGDHELFAKRRYELFEAVAKYEDIIPSLALHPIHEIERASTTPIVSYMLRRALSKPFVVANIIFDLFLHIILMLVYNVDAYSAQSGTNLSILVYPLGFYFLVRKLSEASSMMKLSPMALRSYFFNSPWNVIDILAIFMTLATPILVNTFGDGEGLRSDGSIFAFTTGLLWIKLVSYLKSLNVHIATFVLATVQILRDVFWFLALGLIFMLMTAEMLYILFYRNEQCGDDGDEESNAFCNENLGQRLKAVYGVLLGGDLNLDDYNGPANIVFVTFTFMGIIVMLNILIAIVCNSYDTSREQEAKLFGRARVEFAAERISLENSLRRVGPDQHINFFSKCANCAHRGLVWSGVIVGGILNLLWIILQTFDEDKFDGFSQTILTVLRTAIAVITTICQIVIVGVLISRRFEGNVIFSTLRNSPFVACLVDFVNYPLIIVGELMLGTFGKPLVYENVEDSEKDEWSERSDHIIRETGAIIAESEARINAIVKASETRILNCNLKNR